MLNCCSMEEIPNGNLNVSNPSSSTFNAQCSKTTESCKTDNLPGEIEDSEEILSCRDAFLKFPNGNKILKLWDADEEDKNQPFLQLLTDHHHELRDIEVNMQCDYIVLQKMSRNQYKVLFDNRFMITKRKKNLNLFKGFILNKKGALIKIVSTLSNMPKIRNLKKNKKFNPEEKLWMLVDAEIETKNPTTYQETMDFFQTFNLKQSFKVSFYPSLENWIPNSSFLPCIEAYTKNDYTLGFRRFKPESVFEFKKPAPTMLMDDNDDNDNDEFQNNNSAAVKVRMTGLNEAYNLGCITLDEFLNLSTQLAETIAVLWIETDEKNEARFATYRDETRESQFELTKDENTWIVMFDFIFKCQMLIAEKKSTILSTLMRRLENFPSKVSNPWKNCYYSLKKCIKEMKVAMYSPEDTILHSIKAHFCFYASMKKPKYFRGVSLNSGAKNDLTMIKIPGMLFFNFGSYLTMDTSNVDAQFPSPIINNEIKNLKKQMKNTNSNFSVLKLCKERGNHLSRQLRNDYIETGKNFLKLFNYDIFSLSYCSLSSLAFNTIWHTYTQRAGIFHHGLEKTKLFQENYLRSFCTGGFSYSCKAQINCGEPLNDPQRGIQNDPNLAQSIREFDLISSYGYAASNMTCPVGFCTGYTNLNGGRILTKCDKKARFHGFEFLSVYYTLWKLVNENNIRIRTVYSNFHQYGFLQLGKLTLDLIVITEEGKIIMYAFDGAWAHGCRRGCPSLLSYVGDQSREKLEKKSQMRDDVINSWCQAMNENMKCVDFATYHVVAGCHEPQYTVTHMKSFFNLYPELKRLIDDYFTGNILNTEQAIFDSYNLTFLAIVDGYCTTYNSFPSQYPLFLQNEKKEWDRFASTRESKKGILLTKDYLFYLLREHGLEVKTIRKIYFYKTCTVLPQIFKELVEARANENISPHEKQLLKNIVNYAAGFFGYNETKHQTKSVCRLVTKVPKRYGHQHYINSRLSDVTLINNTRIMFLQTTKTIKKKRMSCQSALPLYICITEWGKKRLSEILCYFEKNFHPNKYRLLYSNIDNAIIALSTDTLEEALEREEKFERYKFFSTTKPGYLKEEFVFTSKDEWKFVSGFTQNYAILTNQKNIGIHKASALNHVSTQQAFDASCALLKCEKFSIAQTRRINKMANLDSVVQTFHF